MSYCVICNSSSGHSRFCYEHEKFEKWLYAFEANIDIKFKRPDKHSIFLEHAKLAAKRSPDSQTQCGCVLVKNDRILSTGYNGWNAGSNDLIIPNQRPTKYQFVIHAELNALLNAAKEGISVDGASAYVTGPPCPECAKALIQCNVKQWYLGNTIHSTASEEQMLRDFLIAHHKVKVIQLA